MTEYNYSYFLASQDLEKVLSMSGPSFHCQGVTTGCSFTKILIMREDTNEGRSETLFLGIKGSHSVSNEEN